MRNESTIVKCRKSGGSAILVAPAGSIGKSYERKIWINGTIVYSEVDL